VECQIVRVESISDLANAIAESPFNYVHLSTHGVIDDDTGDFLGWWSHRGTGSQSFLQKYAGSFDCKALISTACRSGRDNIFPQNVVDVLGANYYIAPRGSPTYRNVSFFLLNFYHKLFATETEGSVPRAFNSYARSHRNPSHFKLFEKHKQSSMKHI
jgi:hypothetical protein